MIDRAWLLAINFLREDGLQEQKPTKPAAKVKMLPFVEWRDAGGGGDVRLKPDVEPLPELFRKPPPPAIFPRMGHVGLTIDSALFARVGEPSVSAGDVSKHFLDSRRAGLKYLQVTGDSINPLEWYPIKGGKY